MVDGILRKQLWDETTCQLCLDFFTNPVGLDCGHNFCKECILNCWGKPPSLVCPQCQAKVHRKILLPNYQLRNIVDIAQQLNDQAMKEAEVGGDCERHQQPLKFFCKDDKVPICDLCKKLKLHKEHHVLLVEAAAEEYKGQFKTCLDNLRKMKEELWKSIMFIEVDSRHLLDTISEGGKFTVAAYRHIQQMLEEEQKLKLAQIEEMDEELAINKDEILARLSKELSSFEKTIREVEEECEKLPGEVLKNIKGMLERCEQKQKNFENRAFFEPALKWRIWDFFDNCPSLETFLKDFLGYLKREFKVKKVEVMLEPITLHPLLRISEDGKCLTMCNEAPTGDALEYCGVLGNQPFQSGRYCWEVEVENDGWAVGIYTQPFNFDQNSPPKLQTCVWAIVRQGDNYRTLFHPELPPLLVHKHPRKIRVLLNYYGQQVSFFDAETFDLLSGYNIPHRYPKYYPFFGMSSKTCIRLNP